MIKVVHLEENPEYSLILKKVISHKSTNLKNKKRD